MLIKLGTVRERNFLSSRRYHRQFRNVACSTWNKHGAGGKEGGELNESRRKRAAGEGK